MQHAGSAQKDLVSLSNSYHVATLDYDANLIFERTHSFADEVAQGAPASSA
jgi:carboxylesterase